MNCGFSERLHIIDNSFNRESFPERFSNEVYLSRVKDFQSYSYQSPFSIKYVFEGNESYRLDRKTRNLKTNQALVVNEGTGVCAEAHSRNGESPDNQALSIFLEKNLLVEVRTVLLKGDTILELHESLPFQGILFFDDVITDDEVFLAYCRNLYQELLNDPQRQLNEAFYYAICEQFTQMQLRTSRRINQVAKVKASTRQELYRRVSYARTLLTDTSAEKFCLDAVSKEAALSKFLLIRAFKSIYGITPQKYHSQQRLNRARELLMTGRRSISEISYELGYPHIHAFSRHFKRSFGISPTDYRRQETGID